MEKLGPKSIARLVGGAVIALAGAACVPTPEHEKLARDFVSAISDGNIAKATQMIEPDGRYTFFGDPYRRLDLDLLREKIDRCRITGLGWQDISEPRVGLVLVNFGGPRCAVTDQTLGVAVSPRNTWIRGVTNIGKADK